MVNTRSKGRKAESEFKKILLNRGYSNALIERAPGSTAFNERVDLFGMFDLIAFKDGSIFCYQVKCNRTAGAPKAIKAWRKEHSKDLPKKLKCFVVVRLDNKRKQEERWREIEVI